MPDTVVQVSLTILTGLDTLLRIALLPPSVLAFGAAAAILCEYRKLIRHSTSVG